jgi:pyrroline-5-carboxylate reductase
MGGIQSIRIGCIGAGNMGGAIMAALAGRMDPKLLSCYDTDGEKLSSLCEKYGIRAASSPVELVASSDVAIIAVKPDIIAAVLHNIKEHCAGRIVVSIAAGVSIASMEAVLPSPQKIIRVMPNTPVLTGEGMSVLSPNSHADGEAVALVREIFSLTGKSLVLPEKLMNAVTGLSGSGPAFVFTMIQAMADGGVKMGIPRADALTLAAQTVLGAAKMVLETGEDPGTLRGRVTSPGGTTIEGVHVLERSGFSGIVMDAVERAAQKAEKIGGTK